MAPSPSFPSNDTVHVYFGRFPVKCASFPLSILASYSSFPLPSFICCCFVPWVWPQPAVPTPPLPPTTRFGSVQFYWPHSQQFIPCRIFLMLVSFLFCFVFNPPLPSFPWQMSKSKQHRFLNLLSPSSLLSPLCPWLPEGMPEDPCYVFVYTNNKYFIYCFEYMVPLRWWRTCFSFENTCFSFENTILKESAKLLILYWSISAFSLQNSKYVASRIFGARLLTKCPPSPTASLWVFPSNVTSVIKMSQVIRLASSPLKYSAEETRYRRERLFGGDYSTVVKVGGLMSEVCSLLRSSLTMWCGESLEISLPPSSCNKGATIPHYKSSVRKTSQNTNKMLWTSCIFHHSRSSKGLSLLPVSHSAAGSCFRSGKASEGSLGWVGGTALCEPALRGGAGLALIQTPPTQAGPRHPGRFPRASHYLVHPRVPVFSRGYLSLIAHINKGSVAERNDREAA